MPKSFAEAFEAWKQDNRYEIGDDIGWEYSDNLEAGPTPSVSSSTEEDGKSHPAEALLDPREAAE